MDKEFIEQMRIKLEEERGKLNAQLQEMTKERTFNKDQVQVKWDDVGMKEEDNAVEVANFQDDISLERNLETTLERVNRALKKIESGAYGVCEQCGQEIEHARLEAYPEATHCLRHKQVLRFT